MIYVYMTVWRARAATQLQLPGDIIIYNDLQTERGDRKCGNGGVRSHYKGSSIVDGGGSEYNIFHRFKIPRAFKSLQ